MRPTDAAPVIMADRLTRMYENDQKRIADRNEKEISLTEALWGFQEEFDSGKKLLINARSETADTRPVFSYAMRSRRCVIPVSGFCEYTQDKEKVSCVITHWQQIQPDSLLSGSSASRARRNCSGPE